MKESSVDGFSEYEGWECSKMKAIMSIMEYYWRNGCKFFV